MTIRSKQWYTKTRKRSNSFVKVSIGRLRQMLWLDTRIIRKATDGINRHPLTCTEILSSGFQGRSPWLFIGEVVRLIRDGAHQASPAATVIAWDWSWGIVEDDPQRAII